MTTEEIIAALDAVLREHEDWQVLLDRPLVSEATRRAKEAMLELRQLCYRKFLLIERRTT